jgi:Domain of unknown function (DUF6457)
MTRDEWIAEFAGEVGIASPTPEEIDSLLELAAIAAHASERTAAPLACWMAGRSGMSLSRLKEVAQEIGEQ